MKYCRHTYDILWGTYDTCDTSCGIYDKCDEWNMLHMRHTYMTQMWHMWHTHVAHMTNVTHVTHVTHIWHIVWHIWQMWLGHFVYFFNICTLSELAVAVELDQLVNLDIDSDHNWWSHVWSKKFTHYQRVLLWSQKISRLHTLDALVPCSDHISWPAGRPVAGRHHQLVHKVDNRPGWLVQVQLSKDVTLQQIAWSLIDEEDGVNEGKGEGDGDGGNLVASSGRRLACDKSKKLVWSAQAPIRWLQAPSD